MSFRRDSYKMVQRSGNNGINKVEPMSSYTEIKANLGGHHFVSGLDNDIPGLPLICDYTTAHQYSNAMDAEIGINRNTNFNNENRIHWNNDKEVMTSPPMESNPNQLMSSSLQYSPEVQKAIESILQIADHIKKDDDENNVSLLTSFCPFLSSFCLILYFSIDNCLEFLFPLI